MEEDMKDNQFALKYKPEYAAQLYEHMKEGGFISDFNVVPMVRQKTIFAWLKDHEDFAAAREYGRAEFLKLVRTTIYSEAFGTPNKLLECMQQYEIESAGPGKEPRFFKKPNGEMVKFIAKNMFKDEYSEKSVISNPDGSNIQGQVVIMIPDNGRDKK